MSWAIVDIANFYVSAERVFDPSLRGAPVIVLSNNDGCAIARSEEAKALHVKMGDPVFKMRDHIKRHGIQLRSSNYELYADMKASPQGLFARQRFLGHKRNMGYATRFNRAIGSLSGWNSPAGSRLACSQR